MTEAEQAILEKADEFTTLITYSEEATAKRMTTDYYETFPERVERLRRAEETLKFVVDMLTREALDDDSMSNKEKLEQVQSLSSTQSMAQQRLGISNGGGNRGYFQQEARELISGHKMFDVARMWGLVVGDLNSRFPHRSLEALDELAKLEGTDFATQYEKIRPIIDVVQPREHEDSMGRGNFDRSMERRGYIWSSNKNAYVRLAE